jgi:hypothetical protein
LSHFSYYLAHTCRAIDAFRLRRWCYIPVIDLKKILYILVVPCHPGYVSAYGLHHVRPDGLRDIIGSKKMRVRN